MAPINDVAILTDFFRRQLEKSAFLPMPGGEQPADPAAQGAPADPSGQPMDPAAMQGAPADPMAQGAAPEDQAAADPAEAQGAAPAAPAAQGAPMSEDELMGMPLGNLTVGDFMEVLQAMIQSLMPAGKGVKPKSNDVESRMQALEQNAGVPSPVGAMPAGQPAPQPEQPADQAPQKTAAAILASRLHIFGTKGL